MTDGIVQVPPIPGTSGANQKIDTRELTRSDGTVVERQGVALASPGDPSKFVDVTTAGELVVAVKLDEVLGQLKRVAMLLEIMTGVTVSLSDVSRS